MIQRSEQRTAACMLLVPSMMMILILMSSITTTVTTTTDAVINNIRTKGQIDRSTNEGMTPGMPLPQTRLESSRAAANPLIASRSSRHLFFRKTVRYGREHVQPLAVLALMRMMQSTAATAALGNDNRRSDAIHATVQHGRATSAAGLTSSMPFQRHGVIPYG